MVFTEDASNARRRAGGLLSGLSARLLALTLAAALGVAVLIFVPSVAAFHAQKLADAVGSARLALLAADAAPVETADKVAAEALKQARVAAVGVVRAGVRELVVGAEPPPETPPRRIDLRHSSFLAKVIDAARTVFAPERSFILLVDDGGLEGVDLVEVLVLAGPMKAAVLGFTGRALLVTFLTALVVGSVIYAALTILFVRPVRRLARAMARFREEPEDPTRAMRPTGRADEIGEAEAALADLQSQVRQALQQKARLAALGEAAAKINHDLRNVLTNAQLVSDRLAQASDPKIRAQGERLVRAIDRGVRLAQDVLAYGRAEERPPASVPVRLKPLLEEAFLDAAAAATAPTALDLRVDEGAQVRGDADLLHRVFVNLMRNAVVAIASVAGRNDPGTITVGARSADGFTTVSVADDGPGIPQRVKERLFQLFVGNNGGGAGLGLAIARDLARAQGGDVALVSTGATGTVFEVRLPSA